VEKASYLNIGCGAKFHPDWVNVDKVSGSKQVQSCDVLLGLPFSNDRFEVIYHSHVLEHLPKDKAPAFVAECLRVLKPGGIMRVVVPDLENIAREYLKQLEANLAEPDEQAAANYDWIMLELFDQTVRNRKGGEMGEFMRQPEMVNEDYVIDRIGFIARNVRNRHLAARPTRKAKRPGLKRLLTSEAKSLGEFRLGGEVHLWMYDRFSLSRLLGEAGFVNMAVKTPFESSIPGWAQFELDVKQGAVYDPTSLFMEANKPG
jgi:predicted SAM-dependent methyltransferase